MSRFPLQIAPGGKFLQEANGKPFLYQADTAWYLLFALTLDEARDFLIRRREQGFSAVQVMLTGFAGMADREGRQPFGPAYRFREPNESFFRHVDAVMDLAAEQGLALMSAPLWAGCCGEGWAGVGEDQRPKPLNVQGVEGAHGLGKWLGARFAHHLHIGWILGGDNDPDSARDEWRALGLALKQAAPHQLCTFHAASTHSSTDVFPEESWLDFSMIYTYFRGFNKAWNKVQPDVYEVAEMERRKRPRMPFVLGESTYEGEHEAWGSAHQVRKQAYWAMLSGATGHAYGSDNWRVEPGWKARLEKPGANSLRYLVSWLEELRWFELEPEAGSFLVEAGSGYARNDHALCVASMDRTRLVAYVPSPRDLVMDDRVADYRGRWLDPTSDRAVPAGRGPRYQPPGPNSAGDPDWLLALEHA